MFCPSCRTPVQPGQKFCTECGAALATAPSTAPVEATPAAGMPLPPPPPAPAATEPTAAFTVVEQTSYTPPTPPAGNDVVWPTVADTSQHAVVGPHPFRFTPLLGLSAVVAVLAVAAAVLDFVSSENFVGAGLQQTLVMNDLGTSHLVGAIVGALVLVAGAALGATGRRVGTGLAGGAGLALAGMLGFACGLGNVYFDSALRTGELTGVKVTATYEIGFILAVVAAGLAGVAFLLSLREMGADGRAAVPPAIGALGALGTVAVVVGSLLPGEAGSFADNFEMSLVPPAATLLRLLMLALILVGGLLGFLVNRRWGLGMALGSISVGTWLWITAIGEIGDIPIGIAGGNVGSLEIAPHIVTTIGVVVMVVAAVVGLVAAAQQRSGS